MLTTRKIVKAKFEIEVEVDEDKLLASNEIVIANEIVSGAAKIKLTERSNPREVPIIKQDLQLVRKGEMIRIPAWSVDFIPGESTIWVVSPTGDSIIRIKTPGKIEVESCLVGPSSNFNIVLKENIKFCISEDSKTWQIFS
ncbi:hypothetical protein [Chitinophaga varians]|uniref:hypothetical protein n=1 Tax=Chitinophaga varians TaxID=2202339 RepID=UPI00165F3E8F|nr:hypothetical protein [Chitinophaga varians]MBC9909102.1 hypothetical protein [Chitinophaga varians]